MIKNLFWKGKKMDKETAKEIESLQLRVNELEKKNDEHATKIKQIINVVESHCRFHEEAQDFIQRVQDDFPEYKDEK